MKWLKMLINRMLDFFKPSPKYPLPLSPSQELMLTSEATSVAFSGHWPSAFYLRDDYLHAPGHKGIQDHHSPKHSGPFRDPDYPDTILLHYTAGPSASSAIDTLCDPKRRVSAHLVVDRWGFVNQLLSFKQIGWHAGRSRWGARERLNHFSIGMLMVNAGRLVERNGRLFAWWGDEISREDGIQVAYKGEGVLSWWHRYSTLQLSQVQQLCRFLIQEYPIHLVLGHEEVSPGRKEDPGPAFPIEELRRNLGINPD
ncbi:MAG: N-acetylmuramoyl-L-alanine amidase [Candidatus Neomarinimicrobiota bacterium]